MATLDKTLDVKNKDTKRGSGGTIYRNVSTNTDAQNQLLANKNPEGFDRSATLAGFSSAPVNNTMTGDILNSNETALKIKKTVPNTLASGLRADAVAMSAAQKAQADADVARGQQIEDLQMKDKSNTKDLKSIYSELGMQGEKQAKLERQAGIDEKTTAVTEITNQIASKEQALQKRLDEFDKNPQGLVGQGFTDERTRIEREATREIADLSIIQAARTNTLATAQSLIDKKVALETQDLKIRADGLKFFYEENKDSLTKEEDRQFQRLTKDADREYEDTKLEKKNLEDARLTALTTASKNGADNQTLTNIQRATTPEQAIIAMGSFGRDSRESLIKELQIQKLQNEVDANKPITGEWASVVNGAAGLVPSTKKQQTKQNIASAIANDEWGNAYQEIGNAVSDALTGTNKTRFDGARTDIGVMNRFKTAIQDYSDAGGDLGILAGTEESIKRKLGIDSGKASALATQLWREFQVYRNEMTGAAFSASESRDYASVNPTLGKSLNLNLSVIDGALQQLQNRVDSTIDSRVDKNAVQKIRENARPPEDQVKEIYQAQPKNQAAIDAMVQDGVEWSDILKTLK